MTHALDRAAAAGDAVEVLRCCRLFGELENAEAALQSYTAFVRGAMARGGGRRGGGGGGRRHRRVCAAHTADRGAQPDRAGDPKREEHCAGEL
jgi:hypothetical protein